MHGASTVQLVAVAGPARDRACPCAPARGRSPLGQSAAARRTPRRAPPSRSAASPAPIAFPPVRSRPVRPPRRADWPAAAARSPRNQLVRPSRNARSCRSATSRASASCCCFSARCRPRFCSRRRGGELLFVGAPLAVVAQTLVGQPRVGAPELRLQHTALGRAVADRLGDDDEHPLAGGHRLRPPARARRGRCRRGAYAPDRHRAPAPAETARTRFPAR